MEGLIFEILRYARRQVNKVKFWKMAIIGGNFNINFGQTLAPGSSLCNSLRTKLHAWTESSIMVEFMVKFIWQHNLLVGSYHTFKMPPGRLDFWCSKGKKWDPPVTPKLKLREVSQSGFWNISLYPTSVPSFSQIGWPQRLAPGTLSQTKTQVIFLAPFFLCLALFAFKLGATAMLCLLNWFIY